MNTHMKTLLKIKEEALKKAFEANNMAFTVVKNREELTTYLCQKLKDNKKIAVGGSVTLDQMNVIDLIRECPVQFIDRYQEGLSSEERENRFREAFFSDIFITSTNALTMDGHLYNIDGTGNRVSAMIFGPKEVIVIAGINKIFDDEDAAIAHIKNWSAPANAIRLSRLTPCSKTGECMDCASPDRICSSYVKMGYQLKKERIHVILVEEQLGY